MGRERVAGVDIGSRTIELVVLDGGVVERAVTSPTTFDPLGACRKVLEGLTVDALVATGYGRKLFVREFGACAELGRVRDITEIQAHALGARAVYPEARAVLDIGGQDTKAITLTGQGAVERFEMNDRCAAGTGKFLEFMATALQIPLEDFGPFALGADRRIQINSMCTVFAESEATSLMAMGERPENIAMGLHLAIAGRIKAMLERVGLTPPLVFSGGVARNRCMVDLLAEHLGEPVLLARDPELTGALGAALHASQAPFAAPDWRSA